MWILFSLGAAFFAGITTLFCSIGVKDANTYLVTSIKTTVILVISFLIVLFQGNINEFNSLNNSKVFFLIMSGLTTTLLWLFYFKALQLGDVSKVTPVDKTSIIMTLILSMIFFYEQVTIYKIISMLLIILGTKLMMNKVKDLNNNKWFIYALLTAIFTSLATIVGKIGIKDIDSNFAMFFRTIIIFIFIWFIVFIKKSYKDISKLTYKNIIFIILSGITTCLSWLCYFKALQVGEASIVFTVEKLSIVVAIICSVLFLKERLNKKNILGLIIIIVGEFILILK